MPYKRAVIALFLIAISASATGNLRETMSLLKHRQASVSLADVATERTRPDLMVDSSQEPQCRLISGVFALFLQGFLGCVTLLSLLIKRHMEHPKRDLEIFIMDVGKQAVGAGFVHFANIFVSIALATSSEAPGDRCAMYFMNFFLDCTVGVLVVYWLQKGMRTLWINLAGEDCSVKTIGFYGEKKDGSKLEFYLTWAKQCSLFLAALAGNKFIVALWLKLGYGMFNDLGNFIFGPLQEYPDIELVVVMVCCPCLLTMLQMWLFDHFLKNHTKKNAVLSHDS